jgi:hypothetical protein
LQAAATAVWAVQHRELFETGYRSVATGVARQLGATSSDLDFESLDETRIAYFALTPGLSPVYAEIEIDKLFQQFLRGWKAVETASSLLAVGTRLKPGVTEKRPLTLGFDSREGFQISSRCCTSCESNAPSIQGGV